MFTRIRSPDCSVGSIEPDGMRNGSTTNERSTNTNRITGKKLTLYYQYEDDSLLEDDEEDEGSAGYILEVSFEYEAGGFSTWIETEYDDYDDYDDDDDDEIDW